MTILVDRMTVVEFRVVDVREVVNVRMLSLLCITRRVPVLRPQRTWDEWSSWSWYLISHRKGGSLLQQKSEYSTV
jgi:hypothetical protein